MFRQLKSQNLSGRVAEEIIRLIETGQLKPGDKLPAENMFAEELGVSRGILREALALLQYQGFISRKPKDGTYIRELSPDILNESITKSMKKATYKDLIEIRESLEQKIVELAIERADDEQVKGIYSYLDLSSQDASSHRVMDYNFHLKVAELSKNVLLINFIDNYYGLIKELGEIGYKNEERRLEIIEEHKKIVNAILKRDVSEAKDAVVYHLRKVKQVIQNSTI